MMLLIPKCFDAFNDLQLKKYGSHWFDILVYDWRHMSTKHTNSHYLCQGGIGPFLRHVYSKPIHKCISQNFDQYHYSQIIAKIWQIKKIAIFKNIEYQNYQTYQRPYGYSYICPMKHISKNTDNTSLADNLRIRLFYKSVIFNNPMIKKYPKLTIW